MTATAVLGGTVIDGSGRPGVRGDVLIVDGRIAAVGRLGDLGDDVRVVDATGHCVAPGFIDAHSHGDDVPLLDDPDPLKVCQGVTTEVVGNCGLGLAPRPSGDAAEALGRHFPGVQWPGDSLADLFAETDRRGYPVNYVPLVAHGPLRARAAGFTTGPLDRGQTATLTAELERAFEDGVVGVSTGLTYTPGRFADAAELTRLGEVAAAAGGVYATHARSEGRDRLAALDEALDVGRSTGVRVQVSHHKAIGRSRWGTIGESLARARAARRDGVSVGFDAYPYTASSTTLTACLPPAMSVLDGRRLRDLLASRQGVQELRDALADPTWDNRILECGGPDAILVAGTPTGADSGRSLQDLADEGSTDTAGALAQVLVTHDLQVGMVCFALSERDVDLVLSDPHTCLGSDSASGAAARLGRPHPRAAGTFARVLGTYVRERRLLSLPEAVRRMTALPAEVFGLTDVGLLEAGRAGDLVVFDPATVADRATYDDPRRPATGVAHVLIGGVPVVTHGRPTGTRAGRRMTSGSRPPTRPRSVGRPQQDSPRRKDRP